MKIKFYSDDDLSLNKPLKFHAMTIIVKYVFEEDGELYSQLFQTILYMSQCKNATVRKIDVSEETDANKKSLSKECMLCHYWYFKNVGFKFEPHVCNRCHDLLTMTYALENITILSAKGATFRCILLRIKQFVLDYTVVL